MAMSRLSIDSETEAEAPAGSLSADLVVNLQGVGDVDKALKIALRAARRRFGADSSCVARLAADGGAEIVLRDGAPWSEPVPADALRGQGPRLPLATIFAALERRGRRWGLIGLARQRRPFERSALRELKRAAQTLSRFMQEIDRQRIADVRSRIDRKLMEQLRPEDLFYQTLHGLRGLIHYSHSAAILVLDRDAGTVTLAAEQIAWHKGKSARVGHAVPIAAETVALLERGEVHGFDRVEGAWRGWGTSDRATLAQMLDFESIGSSGSPRECSMICAPLTGRRGAHGVLKIAARRPGELGSYEADLVNAFLPHVTVAMRNLRRTAHLERRIIEAEKKHAVADLARGVSHDVNNAMGALIPLVQQMIVDAKKGATTTDTLLQDLAQIETVLRTSRRIFGGMLAFARGNARHRGRCDLAQALQSSLAIIDVGLRNRRIALELEVDDELPPVHGAQGDLEQLLLNLAANARDAMAEGGRLRIVLRSAGDRVELIVTDSGSGIAPELMERIEEPFFTTKPDGNGLGLSICRSIVWGMRGELAIESCPGHGTTVSVRLPSSAAPSEPGEPT